MNKIFFLVYQNGLANVFEADIVNGNFKNHRRVLQDSINSCENFCRGVRLAGVKVSVAWCDEKGDITERFWSFSNFKNSAFISLFARDFINQI